MLQSFAEKKHSKVYSNLHRITKNWDRKFKSFYDLCICNACKTSIYHEAVATKPEMPQNPADLTKSNNSKNKNVNNELESDVNNEKSDRTIKYNEIDDSPKIHNINQVLQEFGAPLIKKRLSDLTKKEDETISSCLKKLLGDKSIDDDEIQYIDNIKTALLEKNTNHEKIQILTILPEKWSIKKMHEVFKVKMLLLNIVS